MAAASLALAARAVLRSVGGGGSVQLSRAGPIATVTLSNPREKNALSPAMMSSLADAVDELEADASTVGLLLRGAGGSFCAGASFTIFEEAASEKALREVGAAMRAVMSDATDAIYRRLPQVSAALLSGHAVGGGAELATCTDFRVWAPDAQLRFVQAQMGLTPGWGAAGRLAEMVGRRKALLLLGTCAPLSHGAAAELGLADACARSGGEEDMRRAGEDFLGAFAARPHGVVRAVRALVAEPSAEAEQRAFLRHWAGPANLEAVGAVRRAMRDRRPA